MTLQEGLERLRGMGHTALHLHPGGLRGDAGNYSRSGHLCAEERPHDPQNCPYPGWARFSEIDLAGCRHDGHLTSLIGAKLQEQLQRGGPPLGGIYMVGITPEGEPWITCLVCMRTSYHPSDVAERYCGACHEFHDHRILMAVSEKLAGA